MERVVSTTLTAKPTSQSSPSPTPPCRYGQGCYRKDCLFSHNVNSPSSDSPVTIKILTPIIPIPAHPKATNNQVARSYTGAATTNRNLPNSRSLAQPTTTRRSPTIPRSNPPVLTISCSPSKPASPTITQAATSPTTQPSTAIHTDRSSSKNPLSSSSSSSFIHPERQTQIQTRSFSKSSTSKKAAIQKSIIQDTSILAPKKRTPKCIDVPTILKSVGACGHCKLFPRPSDSNDPCALCQLRLHPGQDESLFSLPLATCDLILLKKVIIPELKEKKKTHPYFIKFKTTQSLPPLCHALINEATGKTPLHKCKLLCDLDQLICEKLIEKEEYSTDPDLQMYPNDATSQNGDSDDFPEIDDL